MRRPVARTMSRRRLPVTPWGAGEGGRRGRRTGAGGCRHRRASAASRRVRDARSPRLLRPSVRPSVRQAGARPRARSNPAAPAARARAPPADPDPAPGARPLLLIGPRRALAAATAPGPAPAGPAGAPRPSLSPGLRAAGREGARQGSVLLRPPVGGRTAEVRPGARWALWEAPSPGLAGGRRRRGVGSLGTRAPSRGAEQPEDHPDGRRGSGRGNPSPCPTAHPGVAQAPFLRCARVPGHRLSPSPDAQSRRACLANFATYPPAQAALRAVRCTANVQRESVPSAPQGRGAEDLGTASRRRRGTSARPGRGTPGAQAA